MLFAANALAADLSISIEHPLKGKRKAYKSVVNCSSECSWESKQKSGSAKTEVFLEDLKAFAALIEAGQVPKKQVEVPKDTYVHIKFKSDKEETSFTLGMPGVYTGADAEKFSKLNDLIIRLEFLIEKQEGK